MTNNEKKEEKRIHKKKHIMSAISAVILLILLITASVAWFTLQRTGVIEGIGTKVSEWDFIVSLESMGEPLEQDQSIDILANSIKINEIGNGKLAPGSYGSIDLYIRNSSEVVSEFLLTIDKSKFKVDFGNDNSEYSASELTKYLHTHIKFYTDKEYTKEVSIDNPIEGELVLGEEQKVTVYWVWHYDGEFLCTDEMTEEDKNKVMDKYDEEDVIISENRQYIVGSIRIAVSGTQKEPQEE